MAYIACALGGMIGGAALMLWILLPSDLLSILTTSPKDK